MKRALFFTLSLVSTIAFAADADQPHPHQGVVAAYEGAPPRLELTPDELAALARGEPVRKQVQYSGGGRGVAVMDIDAPTRYVWSKIGDYSSYPSWVENLDECEIYKKDGSNVYVRFDASMMGIGAEWFIHHVYNVPAGYVTWTLDYDRKSDLDESVGYWRVTQLSADPPRSRVEYSVDMRVAYWIPGALEDSLAQKGLVIATSWVKQQAEADYNASK